MAPKKIVIKLVDLKSDKYRRKAMAVVAATPGVDSVALAGDAKDQLVVVGYGVDPVDLTRALRKIKKVGHVQLVHLDDVMEEEEEEMPAAPAQVTEYHSPPGYYYNPYQYHN